MHKVKFTEEMRTSRVAGRTHLQAQVNHLGSIINNHYAITQPVEDFEVTVDFKKKKKTNKQLRGFYELLNQILPQYNERECECPEDQINKEDFKDFLKGIGGWQEKKGRAKATIFALHNFSNFKRAYKGGFVSDQQLKNEMIEMNSEAIISKSFDNITKEELYIAMRKITNWAKATIFALHNFSNFKRAYKGELVSNQQLKNEMIEADSETMVAKSFDNITKEELHIVMCKIINWANKNKYQFNISN